MCPDCGYELWSIMDSDLNIVGIKCPNCGRDRAQFCEDTRR